MRERAASACKTSAMFRALLLGSVAAATIATPAFAEDAADSDEIIVTGTREALRAATAEKRAADNVVETLEANDVGKLPDQNVAEAVKRLPGLSVANDQGEGRYVIIRGIDPNLVNVALNGQTLPAPEPGARQVKLDDLPSAMIQSVTVTKSLLANQDANAIGGEVNIRTKTAFDSKEAMFLDARGSYGWYDMNHKSPYELDATAGGRFGADEQFGAVVSVNFSHRPIESENFQGTTAYTIKNGVAFPDQGGLRDYNLTRERLGIVANLDWHPVDGVKVYLRSSYSKFTDDEIRDQNRLDAIGGDYAAATAQATGNFTARGSVLVRARQEDDNTKSATLGGEFDLGGGKLEMSGGWTRAIKEDPLRSEFRFRTGNNAVAGTYDLTDSLFTFKPFIGTDLTKYIFNSLNIETRQAEEELWQARADYSHPVEIGDDSAIQAGFKYLGRTKTNNQDRTNYGTTSGATGSASFQLPSVSYIGDTSFYEGRYAFGSRIDYAAARAYLAAHPGVASITTASTISDSLANDSQVKEKILAGYAMATLRFGDWTVIPGVRIEHTKDEFAAKVVNAASTLADGYNSFGENSYTDLFPGLNIKFEPQHDLLMRGAVTTSIGRPNYSLLVPFVLVDTSTSVPAISTGNPDLKPYKAVNFDAAVEYYPNADSVFSAGFFYKSIDNPIYQASPGRQTNVTFANVTYPVADVTQPINADSEHVSGVEFNAQTQFGFLPGFLGGFGVSANYTHVWGHAKAPGIRAGDLPLAFQSKDVANVQLFYEKYGIAARLAYSFRSAYLDTLGSSAATDQYTDKNGQLDLHVSYQVIPQVTVFGDAINLTDAAWRRYIGTRNQLIERERYGTQLRGGVQVHF